MLFVFFYAGVRRIIGQSCTCLYFQCQQYLYYDFNKVHVIPSGTVMEKHYIRKMILEDFKSKNRKMNQLGSFFVLVSEQLKVAIAIYFLIQNVNTK